MTVQKALADFYRRVDPKTKDLVRINESNVGTVDGSRFTKERALSIYNEARKVVSGVIISRFPKSRSLVARLMSGNVFEEDVTFYNGQAALPDGHMFPIRLFDSNGKTINIVDVDREEFVRKFESTDNRFVVRIGNVLKARSGNTYIPDGNYTLIHYAVKDFVMSDVTNGASTETYNEEWIPLVQEVAALIANESGNLEVSNIVLKFFFQQSQS